MKGKLVFCGLVLSVVLAMGSLLQLKPAYLMFSLLMTLPFLPFLLKNRRKIQEEKRRFDEANAYMSQMAQSFTSTGRILMALSETRNTFSKDKMYQLLTKAICHIENAGDTVLAEEEALEMVEKEYACERLCILHDFMLKAEQRGGSYEGEFRILETIREAWEKAKMAYWSTALMIRNAVAIEYLVLILVCAFMLRQFPKDLSIASFPLTQGLNVMMILCFWLIFLRLDKQLTKGLLKDEPDMSKEKIE